MRAIPLALWCRTWYVEMEELEVNLHAVLNVECDVCTRRWILGDLEYVVQF